LQLVAQLVALASRLLDAPEQPASRTALATAAAAAATAAAAPAAFGRERDCDWRLVAFPRAIEGAAPLQLEIGATAFGLLPRRPRAG